MDGVLYVYLYIVKKRKENDGTNHIKMYMFRL